ncbi:MAG: hypothetical protein Q4E88_00240 [Coriobacteriia bacterium]|nr:hypothetical protein [Coriobacteriia bacterium]
MKQLISNNIHPYYWGIQSTHEVEFVIRSKTDGVIPIDVKSGKNTRSTSAKSFRQKYNSKYIIKASTKNFGKENGIVNIPLYAACLINED